ncbi:hypothetical protein C8T65DRAFT_78027 [Cerioporus squamosus]|nr:hypothetical protein C8T65DRAFT_78027 [Cerioporus squamosus]
MRDGSYPIFLLSHLTLLMKCCPNVGRVTLRSVTIHTSTVPPLTIYTIPHSRPLVRLSVLSCKTNGNSFYPIFQLLSLFHAIEQLHFVNTACSWDPSLKSAPWFTSVPCRLGATQLLIHCGDQSAGYAGCRARRSTLATAEAGSRSSPDSFHFVVTCQLPTSLRAEPRGPPPRCRPKHAPSHGSKRAHTCTCAVAQPDLEGMHLP